jgi:hypothetical protein
MMRQHFGQPAVGHRALVEIAADQGHPALLQPSIHLGPGEPTLRRASMVVECVSRNRLRLKASISWLYLGKAQGKARVMRTERRRCKRTGATYPWIVQSTAMVNHFYFYCVDADFGPLFVKFCCYFLYNAKLSTAWRSSLWTTASSPAPILSGTVADIPRRSEAKASLVTMMSPTIAATMYGGSSP